MKRRLICAIATALAITGGMGSMNVYANNHVDTTYSFTVNSTHMTGETLSRAKQDNSATYVNIETVPAGGAWISVYGFVTSGSTYTNYWNDETVGGRQIITKGKWLVRQNVYEHGGRSAKLYFSKSTNDGTISGKWSPDSSGTYTYLN